MTNLQPTLPVPEENNADVQIKAETKRQEKKTAEAPSPHSGYSLASQIFQEIKKNIDFIPEVLNVI